MKLSSSDTAVCNEHNDIIFVMISHRTSTVAHDNFFVYMDDVTVDRLQLMTYNLFTLRKLQSPLILNGQ